MKDLENQAEDCATGMSTGGVLLVPRHEAKSETGAVRRHVDRPMHLARKRKLKSRPTTTERCGPAAGKASLVEPQRDT
jgi:hypothetical protein